MIGRMLSRVYGWLGDQRIVLMLLLVQPILVKLPLLLNIVKSNPLLKFSGLAAPSYVGLPGVTTIDPNIAFTSHALGTYAANALVEGKSLWWNPYEGVGMPLAGEMQSAALFPPTWLMLLPNGQLIEHILFQIIAAIATYLFIRRLGGSVLAAWFAGSVFSFCGTYAWLANAVINPVCFLPVVLYGVELARSSVARDRIIGTCAISGGLTASLYSGFPETAYLNGLFIAGWTLVRTFAISTDWHERSATLLRAGLAALVGVCVSAPLLVAFVDYLLVANVGIHGAGGVTGSLNFSSIGMLFIPYLAGGLSHGHPEFWGGVGGYLGISLPIFAVAGVAARSGRHMKVFLLIWAVVALCLIYGVEPISSAVRFLPGIKATAVYRYITPSLIFATVVLASLSLDDLIAKRIALRQLRWGYAGTVAVTAILASIAFSKGLRPALLIEWAPIIMQLAIVALLTLALFARRFTIEHRLAMLSVLGLMEAVALFVVPLASLPISRSIYLGSTTFLKKNLGYQRFVSTGQISLPGAISANYGTFFEIGQINWNDLPVPQSWVDYVHLNVDKAADPIVFRLDQKDFLSNIAAYSNLGVRYVTTPVASSIPGLPMVYADPIIKIFELPRPRPYFRAPGCTIQIDDRTSLRTHCAQASLLDRLELHMDGWTATVNGRSAPVTTVDGIFQRVALPAGDAQVVFDFRPPYLAVGYALALLGGLILAGMLGFDMRRWRSPRRQQNTELSTA